MVAAADLLRLVFICHFSIIVVHPLLRCVVCDIHTVQPLWYPIPPLLHLLRGDNSVSLISVTIFGFVSIMIGQEAHFSVAANHGLLINSNAVNVPGDPDRQRYLMSTKAMAGPNTIILSLKRAVKRVTLIMVYEFVTVVVDNRSTT